MKISLEPTSHATPFTHREVENYLPIDTYIFPFKALDKGSSREKVVFEISEMGSCSNIRTFQKGGAKDKLEDMDISLHLHAAHMGPTLQT